MLDTILATCALLAAMFLAYAALFGLASLLDPKRPKDDRP